MKKSYVMALSAAIASVAMLNPVLSVQAEESVYTVEDGDNLSKIAKKVYGDEKKWKDIYERNKETIKDPNVIWHNQQIVLPDADYIQSQEEIVPTPEPTPEPVAETQEQLPETDNVFNWQAGQTYFEQNGLTFEDPQTRSFTLPFVASEIDGDGNPIQTDYIHVYPLGCNVVIDSITKTPSSQAGYVDVVVKYTSSGAIGIEYTEAYYEDAYYDYDWRFNYVYPGFEAADLYTGLVVPSKTSLGDETYSTYKNYEWNGNSYAIRYATSSQWGEGIWDYWDAVEPGSLFQKSVQCTMTITVPEGYDGLVLSINKNGVTEWPEDDDYEIDFDEVKYINDDEDIKLYLRLSDMMQQ